MSFVAVDIEADGPIPGDYSMISFGAVVITPSLSKTFYAELKPISDKWNPDSLSISGWTREEVLEFEDPVAVMHRFKNWVEGTRGRPHFVADNNGFDWQFINWYFWHFVGSNPFGYSSMNLNSLYKGLTSNIYRNYNELKLKHRHTHHPLDDSLRIAEALLTMKEKYNLNINLQ